MVLSYSNTLYASKLVVFYYQHPSPFIPPSLFVVFSCAYQLLSYLLFLCQPSPSSRATKEAVLRFVLFCFFSFSKYTVFCFYHSLLQFFHISNFIFKQKRVAVPNTVPFVVGDNWSKMLSQEKLVSMYLVTFKIYSIVRFAVLSFFIFYLIAFFGSFIKNTKHMGMSFFQLILYKGDLKLEYIYPVEY